MDKHMSLESLFSVYGNSAVVNNSNLFDIFSVESSVSAYSMARYDDEDEDEDEDDYDDEDYDDEEDDEDYDDEEDDEDDF
jgi:hypothetical protein